MNETLPKTPKSKIYMSKLLKNEKVNIIRTGFIQKRSKYLKIWKK
jgi:hypothetical protein